MEYEENAWRSLQDVVGQLLVSAGKAAETHDGDRSAG
jgi:hypothetical protein